MTLQDLPSFDCHCHILPGLDDGARTLEESLFLARKLVSYGYREVVCTPHRSRLFPHTAETSEAAVTALQEVLIRENISLKLIPSLEYRLLPETWRPERLLPWKDNHLLIEFPVKKPEKMGPIVPEVEIRQLVSDGYAPVIAHPERYLWASEAHYQAWRAAGAQFQRNLGAVEGFYGSPAQQRAKWLLSREWYDFLGTDLHNKTYSDFFDKILGV